VNGQPVISVRGEATLEVEPEIAIVSVTIEARDRDRRTVLGRLASRNQHVTDLIKSHGEAVEKLESGPASVHPDIRVSAPWRGVVASAASRGARGSVVRGPAGR
jgi:uncharacterized protein